MSRQIFQLKESGLLASESLVVCQLGTKQIFQVLRASLAIHTCGLKNRRIVELFLCMLCIREYLSSPLNAARALQLSGDMNIRVLAKMPHGISVPTSFEVQLYLHALALIGRRVRLKKMSVMQNAMNSKLSRMVVQLAQKAPNTLIKSFSQGPCAS